MSNNKVWLITGCSTGFGRELAKHVLELGYLAGVASRNTDDVQDIVANYPQTAIAIKLDVTVPDEISAAVTAVKDRFGTIDVILGHWKKVKKRKYDACSRSISLDWRI